MAASWECPALPMINLPLKESSKRSFLPLKPMIAAYYEENPDSFNDEIKQLDQLRESALKPSRDYGGCNIIRRYYAQLHLVKARFPEDASRKIPIEFVWKDAFTGSEYKQDGLQIEMTSILYNIGCLHSQVGSKDGRHTEQDMKEALTHYQCSAGAFQFLHENFGSSSCVDMSPQLIEMYRNLMLGQAQECIVEKSLRGLTKVKNMNISKITMKVAQYYQSVVTVLESNVGAPLVKKHKDWIKSLQMKCSYYTAIAHLYQANSMEEQSNFGYMIAFQQLALQKIQSIGKLPRGIPEVFKDAVKNLTEYIIAKLQESKNHNEQVFHELVPSLETLEPAPGVELVKPLMFQPADRQSTGSDIFSRLVPMSAYEAASVYSEEKAKIMRSINLSVDEKNEELDRFMSSLNVDEIYRFKTESPSMPVDVINLHHEFQTKAETVKMVDTKLKELLDLSGKITDILASLAEREEEEIKEEKEYQERHGPRPESQVLADIWKECASFRSYHQQAVKSNFEIGNVFNSHGSNIYLLAGTTQSLMDAIPKTNLLDAPDNSGSERWLELLAKVDEMKQQRALLVTQLRDHMNSDDITRVMIGESPTNQDSVIQDHLQKHRQVADIIRQNLTAQDNVLRVLTEENAKQVKIRQASQELFKQQELFFVGLIKSAGHFDFLHSKTVEGLNFYQKLYDSIFKIHKRATEVCNLIRKERQNVDRLHQTSSPHNPSDLPQNQSPQPYIPTSSIPPPRPPKKPEFRGEIIHHEPTHTDAIQGDLPTVGDLTMTKDLHTVGDLTMTKDLHTVGDLTMTKDLHTVGDLPTVEDVEDHPTEGDLPIEGDDVQKFIMSMKKTQEDQIAFINKNMTHVNTTTPTDNDIPMTSEQSGVIVPSGVVPPMVVSPGVVPTGMVPPTLMPVGSESMFLTFSASIPTDTVSMSSVNSPIPHVGNENRLSPVNLPPLPDHQQDIPVSIATSQPPLRPSKPIHLSGNPMGHNEGTGHVVPSLSPPTHSITQGDESFNHGESVGVVSVDSLSRQPLGSIVRANMREGGNLIDDTGNHGDEMSSLYGQSTDTIPISMFSHIDTSIPVSNTSIPINTNVPISIQSNTETSISMPSNMNVPIPMPSNMNVPITMPSNMDEPISTPSNMNIPIPVPSNPDVPIPVSSNPDVPIPVSSNPDVPIPVPSNPDVPIPVPSNPDVPIPVPSNPDIPIPVPLNMGLSSSSTTNITTSDKEPELTAPSLPGTLHSQPEETTSTTQIEISKPSPLDTMDVFALTGTGRHLTSRTLATPSFNELDSSNTAPTTHIPSTSFVSLPIAPIPPPLSVTTLTHAVPSITTPVETGQPFSNYSSTSHLEKLLMQQQETIQIQTKQLDEQKDQLKTQTRLFEEQRKEIEQFRLHQRLQEKDKATTSGNQSMLMNLLQQQQGIFTQQQSQMDKLTQEGEARRQRNTDVEMKLRDAFAQEQFQNQSLHSQLVQMGKDLQHLQQQLQISNQQQQSLQSQGQQYLIQIQERDKVLSTYRDEHRTIVEGMESQFKQKLQLLTQQVQTLQAELKRINPHSSGLPIHALPPPLQPQQTNFPPQGQQAPPTSYQLGHHGDPHVIGGHLAPHPDGKESGNPIIIGRVPSQSPGNKGSGSTHPQTPISGSSFPPPTHNQLPAPPTHQQVLPHPTSLTHHQVLHQPTHQQVPTRNQPPVTSTHQQVLHQPTQQQVSTHNQPPVPLTHPQVLHQPTHQQVLNPPTHNQPPAPPTHQQMSTHNQPPAPPTHQQVSTRNQPPAPPTHQQVSTRNQPPAPPTHQQVSTRNQPPAPPTHQQVSTRNQPPAPPTHQQMSTRNQPPAPHTHQQVLPQPTQPSTPTTPGQNTIRPVVPNVYVPQHTQQSREQVKPVPQYMIPPGGQPIKSIYPGGHNVLPGQPQMSSQTGPVRPVQPVSWQSVPISQPPESLPPTTTPTHPNSQGFQTSPQIIGSQTPIPHHGYSPSTHPHQMRPHSHTMQYGNLSQQHQYLPKGQHPPPQQFPTQNGKQNYKQ